MNSLGDASQSFSWDADFSHRYLEGLPCLLTFGEKRRVCFNHINESAGDACSTEGPQAGSRQRRSCQLNCVDKCDLCVMEWPGDGEKWLHVWKLLSQRNTGVLTPHSWSSL